MSRFLDRKRVDLIFREGNTSGTRGFDSTLNERRIETFVNAFKSKLRSIVERWGEGREKNIEGRIDEEDGLEWSRDDL